MNTLMMTNMIKVKPAFAAQGEKIMKVSKETAARHRDALRAVASRLFREQGFDRVGIAEIAAAAGLTHGAFYTHFASKEALCIEAVEEMTRESTAGLLRAPDLAAYFATYFSPLHVSERGRGCPFAALVGDAARDNGAIKSTFSRSVEGLFDALAELLENRQQRADLRAKAIGVVAMMIGGLLLARVASSAGSRDQILAAVAAQLGEILERRSAN
jgi:TetR/AcrR family transcriptional regulator, transcriptional repressor for nem operon